MLTQARAPRSITHRIAFDATSKRRIDENGFMYVEANPVTKEQIAPYYGAEINGWEELGLDPERVYHAYRSGEELDRAAPTFNGMPLLLGHHVESAEQPQKEHRVGSLGTDAAYGAPYVRVTLIITDAEAIEAIESGRAREISAGYAFDPDFTPGAFDGQPYDFVMRNIRANHVALVREGRAGPDVGVEDSRNPNPPGGMFMKTKKSVLDWARRVMRLARDEDPEVKQAEVEAAKEILAANKAEGADADLGMDEDNEAKIKEILAMFPDLGEDETQKLATALAALAGGSPKAGDEETGQPGTGDEGDAGAVDAEEVKAALDGCGLDADNEEFQKAFTAGVKFGAREETPGAADGEGGEDGEGKEKKDAEATKAQDTLHRALRGVVKNVRRAPALAADAAMQRLRALNEAARTVRPLVGDIVDPLAFDSAEAIYGKALDMAGLKKADYPRTAWRGMCDVLIKQRTGGGMSLAPLSPSATDAKADPTLANLSRIRVEG